MTGVLETSIWIVLRADSDDELSQAARPQNAALGGTMQ